MADNFLREWRETYYGGDDVPLEMLAKVTGTHGDRLM